MSAAMTSTGHFPVTVKKHFRSKAIARRVAGLAGPATNSRLESTSGSPSAKRVAPTGDDRRTRHGNWLIRAWSQP